MEERFPSSANPATATHNTWQKDINDPTIAENFRIWLLNNTQCDADSVHSHPVFSNKTLCVPSAFANEPYSTYCLSASVPEHVPVGVVAVADLWWARELSCLDSYTQPEARLRSSPRRLPWRSSKRRHWDGDKDIISAFAQIRYITLHDPSYRQTTRAPSSHYLVVRFDGTQLHHELKAQQVVGADGLQFQQFTQSHQLGALQMLQCQFVLEKLGEFHDVLRAGLLARVSHLHRTMRSHKSGRNAAWWNSDMCHQT